MKTCTVFAGCSIHVPTPRGFRPAVAIVLLAFFAALPWRADGAVFDDFESYAVGSNLHGQGDWAGWAADANAGALVSSNVSFSPIRSVNVIGSNDLVRTFTEATNGQWVFSVMQYIPSASSGTNYVTLLNTYRAPYGAADVNRSVRIRNDLATGQIISDLGGGATLPLVTDQWAQLRFEINLASNSVAEFYHGQLLSTHVWQDGTGVNQIQALEMFANNAGPVHYDDVSLTECCPTNPCPPQCGGLSIQQSGTGNVLLAWAGDCQLQATTALGGLPVWADVAGSSPLVLPANGVRQFFRTVTPGGFCSSNIVGYVNFTLTDGNQYLLANPLNRPSNHLDAILPLPPSANGTVITRFDPVMQTTANPITRTGAGWITGGGSLILHPGEGFFIAMQGTHEVTFVGEVPQGNLVNPLSAGSSYQSSIAPIAGQVSGALGFPASDGDQIQIFNPATQTFEAAYDFFDGSGWFSANPSDPGPLGPIIPVGTGFIYQNAGPAKTWSQTFVLSDCAPPPLTITCPADITTNILGTSIVVNYPDPIVTGGTLAGCLPASGSVFALGTTIVRCTATNAWCTNTCTFNVTVQQLATTVSYTNSISTGYNLIANQLDRGSNTLSEIMPVVPEGSFIFKYDNAVGIYLTASFYNGMWQPGNLALNPGEGAWLYSPANFALILTGSPHVPVLPLPACAGYRILSRQTNDIGTFDNIMGRPPRGGDMVFKYNGGFSAYTFDEFDQTWSPNEPTLAVGEAVFIREFTGPSCPGGLNTLTPPPVITTQPLSQTVSPGANVTFSVVASGDPPLTYQWRLNGVNLAGETNISLTVNNVQPGDSGAYSVVVANMGGATVSQIAALDVVTGGLGFADNFADRILVTTAAGVGSGSNTNATKEPTEPDHADNSGGKSVWLAWQSPANGIATFSTAGSGFDTLLAVYRGTNLALLKRSASDDDSAGFYTSEVRFNAVAGVIYNLAIDGSYAASDHIVLSWELEITTDVIPEIVTQPKDRIVLSGSVFTLLVDAGAGSQLVDYQWFLNDQPVRGATSAALTISNALPTDLGLYRVRVSTRPPGVRQIVSRPAAVQMSVVQLGDFANVIARDKFLDSTSLGLDLEFLPNVKDGVVNAAPAAGFTGTQIFNTYGAAKEPGEPNHCGETGGASYWFAYRTPANGRVSVNTSNSTFNTVLAVYSGADPVTSFAALSCVACANVAGFGDEVAEFQTTGGRTYYIVVDGVGGVTGTVRLSYDMITARPVVANQPRHVAVTAGNNGTVSVAIANTSVPPLAYQWQFNSVNLPAATQSSYTRPGFQSSHQGNYRVIITNLAGAVTSSFAMMYLDAPVRSTNSVVNGSGFFQSQWSGPVGSLLIVQVSTNLINWSSVSTSTVTAGTISYTDNTPAGATRRYYRTQLAFP